jgi:hypothetical protein
MLTIFVVQVLHTSEILRVAISLSVFKNNWFELLPVTPESIWKKLCNQSDVNKSFFD